jgi:hypothetical protein
VVYFPNIKPEITGFGTGIYLDFLEVGNETQFEESVPVVYQR